MNTVHATRPTMDMRSAAARVRLVTLLVTPLLCVAVFVCAFALGRTQRPAGAAQAQALPGLPVAAAGVSIPVSLGSAAPVDAQAPPPAPAPVTARHAATDHKTGAPAHASEPSSTSVTPAVPATPTVSATTPVVPPKPAAPAPAPAIPTGGTSTPGGSGSSSGSGASPKPQSGGSTSFENSG
jgi:hypothetical protein